MISWILLLPGNRCEDREHHTWANNSWHASLCPPLTPSALRLHHLIARYCDGTAEEAKNYEQDLEIMDSHNVNDRGPRSNRSLERKINHL
mmetsp:Transcript_1959/g.3526  ORF Transcript_1959/g.3526 Transcript_1959/m.3526 type:complete len:90 (-) Transcript_1959:187-456(-)